VRAGASALLVVGGWLALVLFVAWRQRGIELDVDGVHVRRWTDRWFRRPVLRLGPPDLVRATLTSPLRLALEGDGGKVSVSLRLWPHSARQELVESCRSGASTASLPTIDIGRVAAVDDDQSPGRIDGTSPIR
jgi:hypothetical protein